MVWCGVVCQCCIVGSVHFPPVTRIKSLRTPKKAVFDLKLIVGWGQHKIVFDKSGFRKYYVGVDWGLNFLSVSRNLSRAVPPGTFLRSSNLASTEKNHDYL